ncbi:MAG: 4-coumarate--CoA ligase [Phenylobacterium sp. RIFCSPHIGHO2_01_FULL_69_31]|uniref:class I adenylate-forming enzyme family protein n=1 Tax=Phenylobacterium sp. RIFCSPHIGHO2_01_FULL_69_31 TaxID=1801944 RepID=UPI0008D30557|nr:class I adenylate-forming enzyme family protein [Phenylobacterium sp. RIFCSPHIGHO2_01_FULL_69_31]OHB32025.1 MAG: 4-coumarate--CoA ligase [Phenylobacterium sp. RIFCSPHIGHO2_01_FULL_69_31]
MTAEELLSQEFGTIADVIRAQAAEHGDKPALVDAKRTIGYRELDALMDRIAAALQRDGVGPADVAAICATTSAEYGATFFGILRAAATVAPLAPSSTPESLVIQLKDSGAKVFFLDAQLAQHMAGVMDQVTAKRVSLDGSDACTPFEQWLAPEGAKPVLHAVEPDQGFNIIYSSGTTGAPKGIVQPHRMRWGQIRRGVYPADAVTMISTPLYSNTTLVSYLPTISNGGTAVLMPKFDVKQFLELSQKHRATHAMLVPVQYRRLMEYPDFDRYDLASYQMKFATSAPFSAELKRQVLDRWPGGLVEFYGMTEGGGSCGLQCHEFPDKLHTVGRPLPGHDIRLIGEDGKEVAQGEVGEVVGRSGAMMVGYHNQPGKTSEAEWYSPEGLRFIRTGDVGRFDEDGFLTLMDRKKDMIISGGFNIYPSDLEAELHQHPAVLEAAVVGVPSDAWGETPVAFVALKPGASATAEEVKGFVNGRVGKTQRLADLTLVEALPRSHIGKVLKRELRDGYKAPASA